MALDNGELAIIVLVGLIAVAMVYAATGGTFAHGMVPMNSLMGGGAAGSTAQRPMAMPLIYTAVQGAANGGAMSPANKLAALVEKHKIVDSGTKGFTHR